MTIIYQCVDFELPKKGGFYFFFKKLFNVIASFYFL